MRKQRKNYLDTCLAVTAYCGIALIVAWAIVEWDIVLRRRVLDKDFFNTPAGKIEMRWPTFQREKWFDHCSNYPHRCG